MSSQNEALISFISGIPDPVRPQTPDEKRRSEIKMIEESRDIVSSSNALLDTTEYDESHQSISEAAIEEIQDLREQIIQLSEQNSILESKFFEIVVENRQSRAEILLLKDSVQLLEERETNAKMISSSLETFLLEKINNTESRLQSYIDAIVTASGTDRDKVHALMKGEKIIPPEQKSIRSRDKVRKEFDDRDYISEIEGIYEQFVEDPSLISVENESMIDPSYIRPLSEHSSDEQMSFVSVIKRPIKKKKNDQSQTSSSNRSNVSRLESLPSSKRDISEDVEQFDLSIF